MSKIYYVTKYALTNDGKIEECACEARPYDERYVNDKGGHWSSRVFRVGSDAFETLAEAEANVRKRAAKKITSLRKQIDKLEKLAAPVSSEKEG